MNFKISDNFHRNDFACQCGQCDKEFKMSMTIIGILEHLQAKYKDNVNILRAYVCETESKVLYGSSKDYHHLGKAVDFNMKNVSKEELFKACEELPEIKGIGFMPQEQCVHIDIRDKDRDVWVVERNEKISMSPQKRKQYNLE